MKKSEIYYYTSIAAMFMTFLTGFGFLVSIVLLVLIDSENKMVLSNLKLNEVSDDDLEKLKIAKKLSIINLIINAVLIVLAIIFLLAIFGFAIFNIDALFPDYHN